MTYEKRFENALRSLEPLKALNLLVLELSAEGHRKAEIYKIFENFVFCLRKSGRDREVNEEVLLEVMDALSDWCHPIAKLLPNEEVQESSITP